MSPLERTGLLQSIASGNLTACGCIGPQRGEPRCPCAMRGVVARGGRWVQLEVDLGPVLAPQEQLDLPWRAQ